MHLFGRLNVKRNREQRSESRIFSSCPHLFPSKVEIRGQIERPIFSGVYLFIIPKVSAFKYLLSV